MTSELRCPWPEGIPYAYTSQEGVMKYVNKALAIARGLIRRANSNSVVMFTTIGPDNLLEMRQFIKFHKLKTPQDFGAIMRLANRHMIEKFGLDGQRLFIQNMEPSGFTFGSLFPTNVVTKRTKHEAFPIKSATGDARHMCMNRFMDVPCSNPAVQGNMGMCEVHRPLKHQRTY